MAPLYEFVTKLSPRNHNVLSHYEEGTGHCFISMASQCAKNCPSEARQ